MIEINADQLLTTEEVSARLLVHTRTLERWIGSDRFPRDRYHAAQRLWPATQVDARVEEHLGIGLDGRDVGGLERPNARRDARERA